MGGTSSPASSQHLDDGGGGGGGRSASTKGGNLYVQSWQGEDMNVISISKLVN